MKEVISKATEKVTVFLIEAVILILGFILWTGLSYSVLGSMQEVCDNISQAQNISETM